MWSTWIECPFNSDGTLNGDHLKSVPNGAGVYAIATQTGSGYNVQYVGRSGRSMRGRLESHLKGRGNHVIASLLAQKRNRPQDRPNALYVAYLETKEHKLVEAAYIDASDRPICNLIKAKLPQGLREEDVFRSSLDH